jgi:hypothetical protein
MEQKRTNTLAIVSLIMGILWLCGIGSLIAIITGHIARKNIRQNPMTEQGTGLATGGLVLGYFGLIATIATSVLLFMGVSFLAREGKSAAKSIGTAIEVSQTVSAVADDVAMQATQDPTLTSAAAAENAKRVDGYKIVAMDQANLSQVPAEKNTIGVNITDGNVCAATAGKGKYTTWSYVPADPNLSQSQGFSSGTGENFCTSNLSNEDIQDDSTTEIRPPVDEVDEMPDMLEPNQPDDPNALVE